MKLILALSLFLQPLTVWAAEDIELELNRASQFVRQGQGPAALDVLEPLTKNIGNTLTTPERIRSWFLLGAAYEQTGKVQDAEAAFDQSLHLLREAHADPVAGAGILTAYGALYRDIGETQAAVEVQTNALHLYERSHDHAGISIVCRSLAEMELDQRHMAAGRRYLQQSIAESKNAGSLNDDFFASLAATQAKLAEMERNPAEAVAGYLQAINLWERSHGVRYDLVGWGYVRLGKALAKAGDIEKALTSVHTGLGILSQTSGSENVRYYSAELAYAGLLEASGARREGAELRKKATGLLQSFYREEHNQGTVSAAALSFK